MNYKQSYIENIAEGYIPDVVIIVETWKKCELKLLNDYGVYQTINAHQWACIIRELKVEL